MRIYVAKSKINFIGKPSEYGSIIKGMKAMSECMSISEAIDLSNKSSGVMFQVSYDKKEFSVSQVRALWKDVISPSRRSGTEEELAFMNEALNEFKAIDDIMEFPTNKKKKIIKFIMENSEGSPNTNVSDYVDMCIQLLEVE